MPNTYVALRTETLVSATNSVTFSLSGISGYTDLVLVMNGTLTGTGAVYCEFNGDTASNYSSTYIQGQSGTASSNRDTRLFLFGLLTSGAGQNVGIANIMNYSNATTFKTVLSRANDTSTVNANVGLWRSTSAITSIALKTSANNFAVGSTFSLYGIANADQGAAKATGGIITEDSQYWYHTFGASGAFVPKQSLTCDVLVVAGGGGGGGGSGTNGGGGGGAGGWRELTGQSLTTTTYTVTVGGGGAGGAGSRGTSGSNSSLAGSGFTTLTRTGGGGGGINAASNKDGLAGGSGGGAGATSGINGTGGAGNAGSYSPVEGYAGGNGSSDGVTYDAGGGGGGAGGIGANATSSACGNGGIGATSSFINAIGVTTSIGQLVSSNYYIAGGAGGGSAHKPSGTGGSGGGGNGAGTNVSPATNGIANTGSGGGGGSHIGSTTGSGGSGVVVIRYAK